MAYQPLWLLDAKVSIEEEQQGYNSAYSREDKEVHAFLQDM